jgi:hypothetical protein
MFGAPFGSGRHPNPSTPSSVRIRNVTIGFLALGFSEKPASGSSFGSATIPVWILTIFIRPLRTG